MKAIWKGTVIAKSEDVEELEGHFYFPLDSINQEFFLESRNIRACSEKGEARYLHIMVEGNINEDAAWVYHQPHEEYEFLKDRIAFRNDIEIKESSKKINWEMIKVLNSFF